MEAGKRSQELPGKETPGDERVEITEKGGVSLPRVGTCWWLEFGFCCHTV